MKLYDFLCNDCGQKFEDLVRELSDARCPACESANVEKQLSAFAIGGSRAEPAPPTGGGCSSGFCGTGGCGFG
ncbi:MAG: zinc ribbon domain-containing protein [Polyangiaceae bacterium]|nr:zinc ribbon domain-containing protein [Polyangiaceae bacterium]